jgi:hypothetical protein
MDKRYIKINENIWAIENESDEYYEIHTRDTWGRVNKDNVYVKSGSSLLYYDGEDIEVLQSKIEIETDEEYEEWLHSQNKNINSIDKFSRKRDYGYKDDRDYSE